MPFFTAYSILSSRILINVVVAVLLDNFIRCVKVEEWKELQAALEKERQGIEVSSRVLDPLMKYLSKHDTEEHFQAQVQKVFSIINFKLKESVNFDDVHKGLKALGLKPMIELRKDDFDYITAEGRYCNELGEISAENFSKMISRQYKMFCARKLCDLQKITDGADSVVHLATKMVLVMEDPDWKSNNLFRWKSKGRKVVVVEEEEEESVSHHDYPESLHDLPKSVLIENLERIKQERNEYKFQLDCMARRMKLHGPPLSLADKFEMLAPRQDASPPHVNRFVPSIFPSGLLPMDGSSWLRQEGAAGGEEGQARKARGPWGADTLFVA